MKLCFAFGNLWRFVREDRLELIELIKPLNVDGIELTLPLIKEFETLNLTRGQAIWIRSLSYVSIHAPFLDEDYSDSFDKIKHVYDWVKAKTVVIHPNNLPSKEVLDKFDMNCCTENLVKSTGFGFEKISEILEEYPKLGLCLDVSHSFTWGVEDVRKFVDKFKDRIVQVHFSGSDGKRTHLSMDESPKEFFESIKPLKELDVPIIIEEDMKSLDMVESEVEKIRSLLG